MQTLKPYTLSLYTLCPYTLGLRRTATTRPRWRQGSPAAATWRSTPCSISSLGWRQMVPPNQYARLFLYELVC